MQLPAALLLLLCALTFTFADHQLFAALLGAVRRQNHSVWPQRPKQWDLSAAQIELALEKLLHLWDAVPNRTTASLLTGRQRCDARELHRNVIQWLLIHQPSSPDLTDRLKAHMWGLGLLLHPQQWPLDVNPHLTSQPVHRCAGMAGCPAHLQHTSWPTLDLAIDELELSLSAIANECRIVLGQGGGMYEEPAGLQLKGSWRAVDVVPMRELFEGPIKRAGPVHHCGLTQSPATCSAIAKFATALQRSTASTRALGPHPWLQEARFHLMLPGTRIVEHTALTNQRLKIHCGLRNPGAVALRIANHTLAWKDGRCFVIDDS